MKKSLKTVLSVILTAAMLLTVMLPAFAASGKAADNKVHLGFEKVENGPDALHAGEAVKTGLSQALPVGDVRVSIVLDGQATLEKGFSTAGIASNRQAMTYRAQLLANQNVMAEKISKEVLGGKKLNVKWNITLAANIISAEVPSVAIDKIAALKGVKKVVVEQQYAPAVASVEEAADPNMATSTQMTGAAQTWANGYTGLGSKIAVIDTGIDTDHQSFSGDGLDYAVEQSGKEVDLLTADEVADLYSQLNIAAYVDGASAAYVSSKIPFAINYVDRDLDVTHDNDNEGEHGSHVAGIAAANRFIATEDGFENALLLDSVLTQGAAPDAQILCMKVFGKGGGAYDSDYMVAIEDAVMLGADSINLSLGSGNPGMATDDTYQDILDSFQNYEAVVTISAGNSGAWADSSTYGVLWGEDVSYDTVGSPGSFANAFTVASVDNDGATGPYFVAHGFMDYPMFYTETTGDGKNEFFSTLAGDREFIYINTPGYAEDFEAVADVLEGKIAICNRGDITFVEKCTNAASNGAIGVIIANNQPGTISMALGDYEYTAPAVSITQENAYYLRTYFSDFVSDEDTGVSYYTGTITVGAGVMVNDTQPDYHNMSSFSSFGVPGDLSLKPEITAPGGNIYSVNGLVPGGQAYENMSGTSMAAPQIAGLTALVAQYIRENGLAEKTGLTVRQLAQSLLMSTAEPMLDGDGYYYPVFQQGAGLANADSAINAKSYVLMDEMWDYAADGKVKAELGDDPDRIGEYEVSFSLNNFTDEDVQYDLLADTFTQYIWNYYGLPVRDKTTDYVYSDIEWIVNGESYDAQVAANYDFNDDGLTSVLDVRFLLDYIVGNEDAILANEDKADYDEDGDIDTFDAYQILKELNSVTINAPAGGKVDITAKICLDPDDIGYYDCNGNYVEGYIYASEVSTADGAYGVTHSIPVLGFYGNWTEASMTDIGSVLEYDFDMVDRYPYVMEDENDPSVQGFLVKYAGESSSYYLSGNPVLSDDYYLPERNSFNTNDKLDNVTTTLIRNAAASRFYVEDGDGEVIYEQIGGPVYSAFYYVNRGAWYYTSNSVKTNYSPDTLEDGDAFTFNLTYAPEYYVGEDGSVDWDALGEGATISMPFVVDNTAPELNDVVIDGYNPETGLWNELTFTAKDNRYIAAVAVFNDWGELLDVISADLDAEEGQEMEITYSYDYLYDNSWFGTDRLLIQVYDYALNVTNYKINFDLEDYTSDVTVYMDDTANVILNSTITLEATVYPWGVDESLIWSSSDETIATVDQNGVVTGVAEGSCVISATSAIAPYAKADCLVTVTRIEKTLNGVVWDEDGRQWLSEIDVAKLPDYTKLTADYLGKTITSVSYGPYDYLFASDDDGEIYILDYYPEYGEVDLTDLGNIGVELSDIAPSASLGAATLIGASGSYILTIDLNTGDVSAFDYSDILGGASIVGVAAFESTMNTYYNVPIDVYFFVDSDGYLYEDAYIVIENDPELPDGTYRFGADVVGTFGYTTDSSHYNSLYFDGQSIFWARFNNNVADIVCEYDIFDLDLIANLGSFADDVWPAAALFEFGVNPIDFDFEAEAASGSAFASASALKSAAVPMSAAEITMPVTGSLTSGTDPDPADPPIVIEPTAVQFTQLVDLTVDKEATNGVITVEYDPQTYTLDSVKSAAAYYSYNDDDENGIVTFAYVTREGAPFAEGDTVATLVFVSADNDEGEYTITTEEINDEHPGTSGDVTVSPEHEIDDPFWKWEATDTGYKATYCIYCMSHPNCELDVEIPATVECFESETATCTEGAGKRYVATVEYEGETLTDELTEYSEDPLGHLMSEIPAEDPTCTDTGNIACFYCERCETYFSDEEGLNALEIDDVVIPATGHDIVLVEAYIPCVKDGVKEHYECLNCGAIFTDEEGENETTLADLVIPKSAHVWDEGTLIKDPTCTGGGVMLYTCLNNPNHTRTKYVPAFGHTMSFVEAVAPTCTEDGTLAYYECEICGGQFADEEGAVPMEDITDPAIGHAMTKVDAVAPTCTEDGNVEYYVCGNCGGFFAEELGEIAIENVVDPAIGHAMTKVDAVAPTCTEDGNVEYYVCANCELFFADEEGKSELETVIDPAIGHAWDEGTILNPATCTEKGLKMFACANDATHVYFEAIDMTGHDYKFNSFVWSEDGKTAQAKFVCANSPSHVKMEDAVMTSETTAPTCEDDGYTVYTATYGELTETNKVVDADTALGHTMTKTEAKAATCTEAGNVEYYTCSVCEKIFADAEGKTELTETAIPATGHTMTKTEAKAATCEEAGNVEYYTCSVCEKTFADEAGETELTETVIKALGHDYKFDSFEWAENGRSAKAKLVCANDPTHVIYEDAELTITYYDATAEKPAYLVYTASYGTASDENIQTEDGEEVPFMIGDVDLDGDVDPADARLALRIALGMMEDDGVTMGELNVKAADVDLKEGATPADARLILRYALGITDPEWGGIAE